MAAVPDHLRKPLNNDIAWLMRKVWDRLHQKNQHFMLAVVGQEGSGKSYTAIRISELVDPSFTADRVIFDIADLLRTLKDGDHEPGQFYVLDEAGVQLGRRTWQQRGQVLANQALQLIRSHNLGLIFTLPRLGELDSQTQGRLQAFLELTEKNPDTEVRGKFKILDPDRTDETGKIYKKYPRRRRDGSQYMLKEVGFTPPSPELVAPYEERKEEFQEAFYEKTLQELEDAEESDEPEISPREVATEIASNGVEKYISSHSQTGKKYINADLIYADYDLTVRESKAVKSLLEDQLDLDEIAA